MAGRLVALLPALLAAQEYSTLDPTFPLDPTLPPPDWTEVQHQFCPGADRPLDISLLAVAPYPVHMKAGEQVTLTTFETPKSAKNARRHNIDM